MDGHKHYRVDETKVVHDTIGGEVILLALEKGLYYSLNGTGAELWNLLAAGHAMPDIAIAMSERYNAAASVIDQAISRLVVELRNEGLIAEGNGTATPIDTGTVLHEAAGAKPPFEQPVLNTYTDMQDVLLLDPIHDVDETGWPRAK